jgi:oxepin-CoA hydrolase/3-oxo-5,6-dehydrosuberyl-CoA semialdehyde dehydrogenase
MTTLRSHVCGRWVEPRGGFAPLYDPCTEEVIAQTSTAGIDFRETLAFARETGGPLLRGLTFAERAGVLDAMYRALYAARDDLITDSVRNTGTTGKDAKFDVDGATGVLKYYASLGAGLGDRRILADGEGVPLGRSPRFWGQHVRVPLDGAAVLINAFNFPLWGFAEKAAAAILAGVPVIVKPATSTAFVTARGFEHMVAAKAVPEGVVSLICGSSGDLLDALGSQDVVAFTGSAATALTIRSNRNLLRSGTRVNIEADSLNAAVLAPDAGPGSDTWKLFLHDVRREITQKSGQKCTAVRRLFVPGERAGDVQEALSELLAETVTGNPAAGSVTMGPLSTRDQLEDAVAGIRELRVESDLVYGTGDRIDGAEAEAGKGFFFGPTLLRSRDAGKAEIVHRREVFGPAATILPYDGSAAAAARLVARADGSLVTSVYSDDEAFVGDFLARGGSYSGRLYLGSQKMAEHAFGSGVALPQSLHGGPGRAGGGEELGGLRALDLYTQRVALQGGRRMVQALAGEITSARPGPTLRP